MISNFAIPHSDNRVTSRFLQWSQLIYGQIMDYNAFNVYRRELAPGTVSLTGDRAQGDDSKHWAYSSLVNTICLFVCFCCFTSMSTAMVIGDGQFT